MSDFQPIVKLRRKSLHSSASHLMNTISMKGRRTCVLMLMDLSQAETAYFVAMKQCSPTVDWSGYTSPVVGP